MNYYQFHVGDYAAHTRNLGLLEDLAYRRMLDAYYVNERPFVGGVQDVAREMLAKWSAEKLHESTVICRVAGVNPLAVDAFGADS